MDEGTAPPAAIRRATPSEAEALSQIALASKAHWGYDADFMARAAPFLTLTPGYVTANEVWLAHHDTTVIGFYAVVVRGEIAVLDHLWLRPADIGHGLGRRLFEHARERAAARGAIRLELEAEPNAVGFYERMGGQRVRVALSELGRPLPVYAFALGGGSDSG